MSELENGLKEHVDAVVLQASERLTKLTPSDLVPMLEIRIDLAPDNGLGSAVFWHGKWFNYGQAKAMLCYLRTLTPNGQAKGRA